MKLVESRRISARKVVLRNTIIITPIGFVIYALITLQNVADQL